MDDPNIGSAAGGALSGAMGGAAFGPIGMGIGAAVGLGLSLFGGIGQTKAAEQQASIQQQMIGTEEQENAVRQSAMELQARRQQMEVLRNNQRARSLALNNATSQGAQFGSGLQGGYGQVAGESAFNLVGVNKSLALGEQMFGLDKQLDQEKISYAQAGGNMATAQGMSSLGGSILSAIGPASRLMGVPS